MVEQCLRTTLTSLSWQVESFARLLTECPDSFLAWCSGLGGAASAGGDADVVVTPSARGVDGPSSWPDPSVVGRAAALTSSSISSIPAGVGGCCGRLGSNCVCRGGQGAGTGGNRQPCLLRGGDDAGRLECMGRKDVVCHGLSKD